MSSSCNKFELLLAQKLDDALLPEEEFLLQSHLQTCADCRRLSDELFFLQQTLSSLSSPPPHDLHARIMDEINDEGTLKRQPPAPVVRSAAFSRRFATTAAALVLLVSALAFGSKLMPNAPTDGQPTENNQSIALPAPPTMEPSLSNEASAPQAKADPPALSVESTPNGASSDAAPAASNSTPDQTYDAAPSDLESSYSAVPVEQPTPFLAARSSSSELTQEDAEALLRNYLSDAGKPTASITFESRSSDEVFYQFLCTDDAGTSLQYSVSSLDGSISPPSAQGDHLPATN